MSNRICVTIVTVVLIGVVSVSSYWKIIIKDDSN